MTDKLFSSSSSDKPSLLNISFKNDPQGNLGAQLVHGDKSAPWEMFLPGYAVVGRLIGTGTVAELGGVAVGDIIVAVNGQGFRRFAPDYKKDEVTMINDDDDEEEMELDNRIVPPGSAYNSLLSTIKSIKAAADPPLHLSFERYDWDARPNAWSRFLAARDDKVPEAMQMIQEHEAWRETVFPIDLSQSGLQKILQQKAVSEIDMGQDGIPTVYVDYGKLATMQAAGDCTSEDVVMAFVIFTERMLAKSHGRDPRNPKTCQFIDLSGVSLTGGFSSEVLKKIYKVFEPNYPETLYKMVMYPVSTVVAATARTMLNFVNDKTQKKFTITNNLDKVCEELGWSKAEVEECGGIADFMHKHEKAGTSLLLDDDANGE